MEDRQSLTIAQTIRNSFLILLFELIGTFFTSCVYSTAFC